METKEIYQELNQFVNEVTLGYKGKIDLSLLREAADRLEELEEINENWCNLNDENMELLRKYREDITELKYQLSEKQPEWISVEDERKPKYLRNYLVAYVFGDNDEHFFGEAIYIADKGNGIVDGAHFNNEGVAGMRVTHWMEIPKLPEPPKPKEPTFKDVFLKAFPKATIFNHAVTNDCCAIFPWLLDEKNCCQMDMTCEECWNQPYFEEEEGEGDA